MGLFSTPSARAETGSEDPWRLHCAAHELGHHVVWTQLGFEVTQVAVTGRGRDVEGQTRLSDGAKNLTSPDRCRDYLIGLLAGREADIRWARHTGRRYRECHSQGDLAVYRQVRRHEWVRDLSDRQLRDQAKRLVAAEWARIVRLTPQLARDGHIKPS